MQNIKIWIRRIALSLGILIVTAITSILVYQRTSDGPTGPLTGGSFSSGELAATPVSDWSVLEGDFEFELVGQASSRTAGGLLLDGNLYISCDLGFVWSRLPPGTERNLLHLIWRFKTWHQHASLDGRIRIRKDGLIYTATMARVEDPELIERLKNALEVLAGEYFGPQGLGPRPLKEPNDIWFFRVNAPSTARLI